VLVDHARLGPDSLSKSRSTITMTPATAEPVTIDAVRAKLGELTALEVDLDQKYGAALLHADDATVQRLKSQRQQTRDQLSTLWAAQRQLEAERAEQYANTKAALTADYQIAALAFDAALAALLRAMEQASRIGAQLKSHAYAFGDAAASQFARLVYDPGATANVVSEELTRLFREQDPWKQERLSLWTLAQSVGLIEEDN